MDFKEKIRSIPDFPKPGILFRDITPLLLDPVCFKEIINELAKILSDVEIDAIAGPESRGFIIGAPLALAMGKPFIPVRKAGKLPYKTLKADYELEYGTETVEMHADAVQPGWKVAVADDLLATGGTAEAITRLVKEAGGDVLVMAFLIELNGLKGREALYGYDVRALISYD